MIDPLPKDLENLLVEIAPHEGEADYFCKRFSGKDYDLVWREVGMFAALRDAGMIEMVGEDCGKAWEVEDNGRTFKRGVEFKSAFALTFNASEYLSHMKGIKASRHLKVIFEVVAFLGSIAAIANLVLYIMWR